MGRASMTRKSPRDGEEDEACVDSMKLLPDLVKEVMRNQHEDLLKHLDSRLDSLCRRIQKENSFIPVRSGSRMQSQSSRHTRTSPTSPSPPTSPSRAASLKLYPPSSSFLARAMTTTIEQAEQAEKAEKAEQTEQAEQGFERSTSHESEADAMPALTHKASDVKSDTSDLGMPKTLTTEVTQVEKRELPKGSARSSVQSAKSVEKTSTSVTNRESEDGLNSYDLAHRQGSRVDFFKKQMMMSSSDVVGSGDLGSGCCSQIQTACAMVVKSVWCELFFALMIVSNSVYLGVQLEMTASNPHLAGSKQELFFAVNMVYAVVFLLEVLLRLMANGFSRYIFGSGWSWNWLDVFVVTSTWIELLVNLFELEGANGISNSNLRLFRIVKITRLARVLRVLRVVQYVRPLRTLMHCLVDTTKSFAWAMMLLLLMMYVFGLLFTDACLDYLREFGDNLNDNDETNPRRHFGTVSASMQTLFRSISNGLDWSEAVDTLLPVGGIWIGLFYLYIAFISFAVLNVMTGVFCHSAIKAAERDHEMVIHSLLQNKREFTELVSNLFFRIDDLGLGMITISEFEKHFNDEAVRAFFESLEMGAADAWTLFASLDADGDNVISLKDFTERCIQLHGPARSVDLYALTQQNAKLRDQLKHIEELQYLIARSSRKTYSFLEKQDAQSEMPEFQESGTHCLV